MNSGPSRQRRQTRTFVVVIGVVVLVAVVVAIGFFVADYSSDDDGESSSSSSSTASTTATTGGSGTTVSTPATTRVPTAPGAFTQVDGPTPTLPPGATVQDLPEGGQVKVGSPQSSNGALVTTIQVVASPPARTLTVESIEAIIPGKGATFDETFVPFDVTPGKTGTVEFHSTERPSSFSIRILTGEGSRVYDVAVPAG